MTDEEIRKYLLEAERLLGHYKALIKPVAEELARRYSAVLGKKHTGELGCWEEGIETICLHLDPHEKWPGETDNRWIHEANKLREQFFEGLENINLDTFF